MRYFDVGSAASASQIDGIDLNEDQHDASSKAITQTVATQFTF